FGTGAELIDLATSLFIPRGVVAISATNTNPLVTSVPEPPGAPRLVWRTTYNSIATAHALSALVRDVFEPAFRAPGGGLTASESLRVALLRRASITGAPFSKAISDN